MRNWPTKTLWSPIIEQAQIYNSCKLDAWSLTRQHTFCKVNFKATVVIFRCTAATPLWHMKHLLRRHTQWVGLLKFISSWVTKSRFDFWTRQETLALPNWYNRASIIKYAVVNAMPLRPRPIKDLYSRPLEVYYIQSWHYWLRPHFKVAMIGIRIIISSKLLTDLSH